MKSTRVEWMRTYRDHLLLAAAIVSGLILLVVTRDRPPIEAGVAARSSVTPSEAPPAPAPAVRAAAVGVDAGAAEPPAAQSGDAVTAAADSPRSGPAAAPVTIIEATNFDCTSCDQLLPLLAAIRAEFPTEVAVVFKSNPGTSPAALPAAIAALAAHRQGRFWPYHDRLLGERTIAEADLLRHARELGLDLPRFDADRKDPALRRQVEVERGALAPFSIGDAPAVLIVGRQMFRPLPFEAVRPAIEEELRVAVSGAAPARPTAAPVDGGGGGGPARQQEVRAQLEALLTGGGATRSVADSTRWKAEVFGHEPVKGKADALVTIVEFSDFQCKYCGAVLPALQRVLENYPDDVRVVWKNLPLDSHDRALPASLLATAAHDRGKFWAVHDRLFASPALDDDALVRCGGEAGMGGAEVKAALRSDALLARVQKDVQLAKRVNALGTPSFFVNGRVLRGNRHFAEFDALIGEELVHARELVAGGVARRDLYSTLMAREAKGFQALDATVHRFTVAKRPSLGAANGEVVVVAFVDFESMNCIDNAAALRELLADPKLKGRVRVVIKQAPHPFHRMARDAAIAALAAQDQGRFWPMHDVMFANQRYLMPFQLEKYAKEAGLDLAKYKAFLEKGEGAQMLEVDLAEARAASLKAAPTVYLNGRRVEPATGYSAATFKELIREQFLPN